MLTCRWIDRPAPLKAISRNMNDMTHDVIPNTCSPPWRPHSYFYPILMLMFILLSYRKRFVSATLSTTPGLSDETTLKVTEENTSLLEQATSVPFFASSNPSILFTDFVRILNQYQTDVNRLISTLTTSYHESVRLEQLIFHADQHNFRLSSAIESRISRMAQILESDGFVLEKLLRPFPITLGLPSDQESSTFPDENPNIHSPTIDPTNENHSYNSGVQILAHITRDWTSLGRPIRKSLYEFCILQLLIHRTEEDTNFTVLVPGAGLGRLAKDLSFDFSFHVEANEISTTMASAAFSLLHGTAEGIIHPFALDYLMNEVFSEDRYQEVPFPDQEMIYNIQWTRESRQKGSLSYTVGDFIQTYSARRRSKTFDAVVTCFFFDTATNIYEYILIIRHVLTERGGIWINVGPLQWHGNSKLRPSADELRLLIEAMGFSVILWTVDKDPMNYRHFDSGDHGVRHTKYEGYNPLRFVVQRTQNGMDDIDIALVIRHLRNNTNTL